MLTKPVAFTCPDWSGSVEGAERFELFHDRRVRREWLQARKVRRQEADDPDVVLRIKGQGAGRHPDSEGLHLGRIVCRESRDRVGSRIRNPNAILVIDDDIERARETGGLDDATLFHAAAREVEQLIALAVGDPDIAVRRNADAHEAVQLFSKRKVLLGRHRMALKVRHQDLAVEARGPDVFLRHGGAPADSVDPCTHEAGDRGRECGTVGAELRDASADAHSRRWIASPAIQFEPLQRLPSGVDHHPARCVVATARKAQDEREVIRARTAGKAQTAPGSANPPSPADRPPRRERRGPWDEPTTHAQCRLSLPACSTASFLRLAWPP